MNKGNKYHRYRRSLQTQGRHSGAKLSKMFEREREIWGSSFNSYGGNQVHGDDLKVTIKVERAWARAAQPFIVKSLVSKQAREIF